MERNGEKVFEIAFDRFKENEIVNLNYASVQNRRQTATNLFMSLYLAFLGAVGFLIFFSHLNSWWAVGALGALTFAVWPINLTWHRTVKRYEQVVTMYYGYLQEIEREIRDSQADKRADPSTIGLYLRQDAIDPGRGRAIRHERGIALYFLLLYPFVTALAAILTYFVMNHLLPALTLG